MTVTVNGRPWQVAPGTALAVLVSRSGAPSRGTAAAVDGEVVPRSAWPEYLLRDGQAVELLTAVQGG